MNHPVLFLFLAVFGSIAGALSQRTRASGIIALLLPVVPGGALWLAIGRP